MEDEDNYADRRPSTTDQRHRRRRLQTGAVALVLVALLAAAIAVLAVYLPPRSSSSSDAAAAAGAAAGAVSSAASPSTSQTSASTENNAQEQGASAPADSARKEAEEGEQKKQEQKTKRAVATKIGTYELLETVPHDATAFTQGLVLAEDRMAESGEGRVIMYEGTGLYGGKSKVRVVDAATGEVLEERTLEGRYFGEGLAYYEVPSPSGAPGTKVGRLIQITWKEKAGFVYDSRTLELLEEFTYQTHNGQGWGITYGDPSHHEFYVTDGSQYLLTWDADTKAETGRVPVYQVAPNSNGRLRNRTITQLNELEYDPSTGTVLSNVWFQDAIIRIDPSTGFVTTAYDLQSLYPDRSPTADVLNGIALAGGGGDADQVWVTGKFWPNMYRIRLVDP